MKTYSFFIKLLVSLTLLLAVPITIIASIFNYEILKYSENDISNYGIGKLKVAENTLKQLQITIFNDSVKLSVNSYINGLSSYGNDIDLRQGNNQLYITHILDVLAEFPRINNKYKSIYLYLDNFKYAFTSDYDFILKDKLQDTGWLKDYDNYKEKKSALTMLDARILSNNYNKENNTADNLVITYIYPLTPYTTNLNGALVINLKESGISSLINSTNINTEGYIFVINQTGEIIAHPDIKLVGSNITQNEDLKKVIGSKVTQGHLVTDVNKNRSLVSYYKSSFNNWTFVGVFPIDALTSKVNTIRFNTLYISLCLIVVGILIAFIVSRKIYSPVEKLIKDIKAVKGSNFSTSGDEVSIISKAFASLLREEKGLFDMLEKNKREIKVTYFKELLNGNSNEEINTNIVGDNFTHKYYICGIFSIDKYKYFTGIYKKDQQYYMKNLISQVIDEIIKVEFPVVNCCIYGGEIAVIVNVPDKLDDIQERLRAHFLRIQQELSKVMENTVSASLGTVHNGTQGIASSYFEAQTALKQKLKLGYGSIILWSEEFIEEYYYYPVKTEKLITNYLMISAFDEIKEILKELTDDLYSRKNLSSENIIQIYSQLLGNTVIKYLLDQHINIYDIFDAKFNIFNELASKENIYEIREWLEEVYSRISKYSDKLKKNDKKYMKEMIGYIYQNYTRDIGIKDVSDYVGLSYSHVRKIFKDQLGENIIDYINNIRINEAKKILTQMDICIKDIAMNLGYNNAQSFIRFFKKKEGITPGEYRSNVKMKHMEEKVEDFN